MRSRLKSSLGRTARIARRYLIEWPTWLVCSWAWLSLPTLALLIFPVLILAILGPFWLAIWASIIQLYGIMAVLKDASGQSSPKTILMRKAQDSMAARPGRAVSIITGSPSATIAKGHAVAVSAILLKPDRPMKERVKAIEDQVTHLYDQLGGFQAETFRKIDATNTSLERGLATFGKDLSRLEALQSEQRKSDLSLNWTGGFIVLVGLGWSLASLIIQELYI